MSDIVLGENKYGKANVHFLRVVRDTPKHEVFVSTNIYNRALFYFPDLRIIIMNHS